MFGKVRFSLLIVLVGILCISVSMPGQTGELAKKQVLYAASPGRDIRAIDPAFATSSIELFITYAMFDALVQYPSGNEGDLEAIKPDLAKDWKVSEDGKTWTFYLRKGVKFHRGYGELTAEDVEFTFERNKKKSAWTTVYENIETIKVVNDYIVKFYLKKADPFFLPKLANFHGGFIVSKKAVKDLGKQFKTEPVGTGPFQVKEYKPKDRYILVRNEDYWKGKPILEKIIVPFMPDISSRTLALEEGTIHMTLGKTDEQWVKRERDAGLKVDTTFQLGIASWIHFNMTREPFDDIKVRKALAYATCRKDFIDYFGPSITEPLYSPVPPYAFGALPKEEIPEDLFYQCNRVEAEKLLAEAGYPNGFTTKMLISEKGSYLIPMQIIQENWRKVGVNLKFEVIDHASYHSKIRADANPIVWYNASRTPIAGVFLHQWFHSASIVTKPTGITNFSHYGDVDADGDGKIADNNIDKFIDEAAVTMDKGKQKELYAEAQLKLLKDLPAYPIRNYHFVFARQPYVELGYQPKHTMIYMYHITKDTKILKH